MPSPQRSSLVFLGLAFLYALAVVLIVALSPQPDVSSLNPARAVAKPLPGEGETTPPVVRLGYFPNVTHAQALLGTTRGTFAQALGEDTKLTTVTFNAGPTVIEAMMAGHLDLAYVGPSPVINGFLRSNGKALRVIAGAATNGILVIGNKKRGITRLDQLPGKRIATPQLANTQDISAKAYLTEELGARLHNRGGDTEVIPISSPDIETLFAKDQLDAAWVPEPWGSRIIDKGYANLLAQEKDLWPTGRFALTSLIARREFLENHPELVRRFVQAHVEITRELAANPLAVADELNAELKRLTGKTLPRQVILDSLRHTGFAVDPLPESYAAFFSKARALKLVAGDELDVETLVDTTVLDQIGADGAQQMTTSPAAALTHHTDSRRS